MDESELAEYEYAVKEKYGEGLTRSQVENLIAEVRRLRELVSDDERIRQEVLKVVQENQSLRSEIEQATQMHEETLEAFNIAAAELERQKEDYEAKARQCLTLAEMNASLCAKAEGLRDGLEKLEWSEECDAIEGCTGKGNLCPICLEHEEDGHSPDCWLPKLLEDNP